MTNKKSEHHNNTVGASIHASAPSRAAANACPPSSNTGGTVDTQKSFVGHVNPNATKVDWLSFTFDQKLDISEYVSGFSALFELNDLDIITDDLGRGQYGYTNTIVFYSRVDKTQTVQIAQLNWGGQTQNNRAYFSINGHGCSTFSYWQEVKSVLESLHDCKITRLDICLDDMTGEDLSLTPSLLMAALSKLASVKTARCAGFMKRACSCHILLTRPITSGLDVRSKSKTLIVLFLLTHSRTQIRTSRALIHFARNC